MSPRGGTEILWSNLLKYIDHSLLAKVNIILSTADPVLLKPGIPNILWQHVDTNQMVAQGLGDPGYVNRLAAIVFVSHWQKEKYINEFNLPREKCTVLLNAVEPIPWVDRRRAGKIKLLYTSTPWRGLEVLIKAFKKLGRHDIELDVHSSTVIYGANFMPNQYKWLFNICRQTPGINYKGYVANKAAIKAAQASHILSYPSVFAETSCLTAIEAGAAGCKIVTTDLGALPETCGGWADYVSIDSDLVDSYAAALDGAITSYWVNYSDRIEQSKYFNEKYNWPSRAVEWNNLIRQICEK